MTSLSDKISSLINPTPTFVDPEDEDRIGKSKLIKPSDIECFQDNLEGSSLRNRKIELLDDGDKYGKYAGKKTSRRKIMEEVNGDIEEDFTEEEGEWSHMMYEADNDSNDVEEVNKTEIPLESKESINMIGSDFLEDDEEYSGSEDDETEEEDEEEEKEKKHIKKEYGKNSTNDKSKSNENTFKMFPEKNAAEELKKAKCTKNQLNLWDSLLESRIQMQKVMSKANLFPKADIYHEFKGRKNEDLEQAVNTCRKDIKDLLDKLLELQQCLFFQYSKTNVSLKRKNENECDEEVTSDDSNDQRTSNIVSLKKKMKTRDYSTVIDTCHENVKSLVLDSIQKWDEKTKLTVGKQSKNSFDSFETSAVKQINHILGDKERLVRRTQLKRSAYRSLGDVERDEGGDEHYDCEIFDDQDFYHQLLQELIQKHTASVSDSSNVSQKWLEVQKLRSKMKRKVDTRASKGRKIRFDVHNKLVNFMAPVHIQNIMSDKAKTELFSSIFGRKK